MIWVFVKMYFQNCLALKHKIKTKKCIRMKCQNSADTVKMCVNTYLMILYKYVKYRWIMIMNVHIPTSKQILTSRQILIYADS